MSAEGLPSSGKRSAVSPPCVGGVGAVLQEFHRYQTQAFGSRVPAFFALELCGEAGELANCEKKIWRSQSAEPPDLFPLEEEAADVFIALMNYCNSREIDLEKALSSKLHKIENRRIQGAMGPTPA